MAGGADGNHDEGPGAGVIADINVTPLVDITLVLLIIFMVTARLIVARGIDVESPKTVSGADVRSTMEVTIQPGPSWYLNGKQVADKQAIRRATERLLGEDPELRPIITADTGVPYGQVMEIIDVVKLAGGKHFAMTTEVAEDEGTARSRSCRRRPRSTAGRSRCSSRSRSTARSAAGCTPSNSI